MPSEEETEAIEEEVRKEEAKLKRMERRLELINSRKGYRANYIKLRGPLHEATSRILQEQTQKSLEIGHKMAEKLGKAFHQLEECQEDILANFEPLHEDDRDSETNSLQKITHDYEELMRHFNTAMEVVHAKNRTLEELERTSLEQREARQQEELEQLWDDEDTILIDPNSRASLCGQMTARETGYPNLMGTSNKHPPGRGGGPRGNPPPRRNPGGDPDDDPPGGGSDENSNSDQKTCWQTHSNCSQRL